MHTNTSTDEAQGAGRSDERASVRDGNHDRLLADYFTKTELAEELGYHERTLDRWHACRTGPPRTVIGRQILYRRSSVREWLAKRERRSDAQDHGRRTGRRR